jgi:ABC-2 type transport system permease protein
MGIIAHLVAKDVRRKARSPLGLIAALAFPLLFAGLIALAFGRGDAIPKVRILVDNEDDGIVASLVASAFTSQQASAYFDAKTVKADEGRKLIGEGKASALLIIPKGFTDDLLDKKPVKLSLLRNPAEGILPEIAEQATGAIADVLDAARRVFDKPIEELRPLLTDDGRAPADADVITISLSVKKAIEGLSGLVNPPVIALQSEMFGTAVKKTEEKKSSGDSPSAIFLAVLPGVAVYGLFLVGDQGMRDVMTERTLGTMRRQLAAPITANTVILAKAVYTAILAAAALLVMAAVGASVLTAHVSIAGFLLVAFSLVLAVTGTTAVIYGLAKTERQAATLGNMLFLMMGFLGGGFIRVEGLPAAVRAIAPFTPLYWGTKGFRAVLEKGAGVSGVLTPSLVLLAIGVVLLAAGAAALRRTAKAGAGA